MSDRSVWTGVFLTLATACVLLAAGCGSGNAANTQAPPPSISVTLSAPPSSAIVPGGTINVSATVLNDASGSGVRWTCAAISGCGSFNPAVTASGVQTIYTAPAASPSDGKVTITAVSVHDTTKTASFTVTISAAGISVTISPVPPTAIQPGQKISVSATVSNDAAAAGVNWSCLPVNVCGSFSASPTASGAQTNYTAPVSAPAGGTVTIIATSVTDSGKSSRVAAVISGIASNATLQGQYAIALTSLTGTRGTSSLAGSISFDGNGNVLGGVVDIIAPSLVDLQDQITPTSSNLPPSTSSYAVDATGRGTMRIRTTSGQILDFSFVLTSASHALLAEVDGDPGSGTMDLQQHPSGGFTASQLHGPYSFTMTGTAKTNPATKVSFGGFFSADGVGVVNNGTLDANIAGAMSSSSFSGTFSAPDANGRGTLQLTGSRSLIYYIISPKALRIFEADTLDLVGGSAFSRGTDPIFLANWSFYQHSGWSSTGITIAAGQFFIVESDVVIQSGISDSNAGGSPAIPHTGIGVTGTALTFNADGSLPLNIVDAAGHSTFLLYAVDRTIDMFDPGAPSSVDQGFIGNALLLHTDANINGTGFLVEAPAQQISPAFVGNFSLQLTNAITTNTATNELDLTGVVSTDSSTHFTNGLADYDENISFSAVPIHGASFTGTFAADVANPGRLTGAISIPVPSSAGAYSFISPATTSFNVSYYQISPTHAFVVQTDTSATITGFLFRQLFP